jgi:hypothetical protein
MTWSQVPTGSPLLRISQVSAPTLRGLALCHILAMICVATLALGSQPRQKGLQGCGPKGSLGVTSETPKSARDCGGVSLHTPKATPTLGEGVPVDSRNFRERFEGSNLNGSWRFLYH